ncbi:MAG TPA: YidB family protein [Steroidobacteraceae bacterium]|nr:YidB family protein [Steroidobacteraceae bacterium]
MSILSNLESALGGMANTAGTAGGETAAGAVVVSQIISMLQNHPGGVGGLLQSFQQGGLGHVFQSWIANGPNLPVSADQLRSVLGSDWVSRITQATGLPQAQVEQHLSTLLPQIINHLSPNGQMPQGDLGSALAGIAQRVLRG